MWYRMRAVQILESRNEGYIEPTAIGRRHVAMAFAGRGSVVYGKAFDVVRVMNGATVDWNNLSPVEQNLDDIVLYDTSSRNVLDLSLTEMFSRMKGIYPTWSIRF
jgi:hypothetical protein